MLFIWILIPLVALFQTTESQSNIVASSYACFSAVNKTYSTIFNAPYNGNIEAVMLEHVNGSVTCSPLYTSNNWGCGNSPSGHLFTYLYKVTSNTNYVGTPYYPASNTVGYNAYDGGYNYNGITAYDNILTITTPTYAVTTSDEFMLQYSEAYNEFRLSGNSGTACAKVSFTYSVINTDTPSKTPTDSPSKTPTSQPSVSPTYVGPDVFACFSAANKTYSTIFNAPYDGTIEGVILEHVNGSVTCSPLYTSNNWGCGNSPSAHLFTYLYKVTSNTNYAGTPYYPASNTVGYNAYDGGYRYNGITAYDNRLIITTPAYAITALNEFMLQYSEAYNEFRLNGNSGTVCAKVSFIYSVVNTDAPSKTPTDTPSNTPTDSPSKTPTSQPSISPTYVGPDVFACFSAVNKTYSTIFNAPYDGNIEGVILEHVNGSVTCSPLYTSNNWGCGNSPSGHLFTYLYKVTPNTNYIGTPYYPASNTVGYNAYDGGYRYNGITAYDNRLIITTPAYAITTLDEFMLQYSEAYNEFRLSGNSGTACAKVSFIYSVVNTDAPSKTPTGSPSKIPTSSSKTPSNAPSKAHSDFPSKTPTNTPTKSPTPLTLVNASKSCSYPSLITLYLFISFFV